MKRLWQEENFLLENEVSMHENENEVSVHENENEVSMHENEIPMHGMKMFANKFQWREFHA